jgi:hypothetical protein
MGQAVLDTDALPQTRVSRRVDTNFRRGAWSRSSSAMLTARPWPREAVVHSLRTAQRAQASGLNFTSAPRSMGSAHRRAVFHQRAGVVQRRRGGDAVGAGVADPERETTGGGQ